MTNDIASNSMIYGKCDGISGSLISGWVLNAYNTAERLDVEILACTPHSTEVLACLTADQYRPDLAEMGLGDGHHGFRYAVRRAMREEQIYVRVVQTQMMLPGTPIRLGCDLVYDGKVEELTGTVLSGWAWRGNGLPINVEVWEGDRFITMTPAHHLRQDLAALGIGDGRHGFAVDLADLLADGQRHEITCRFAMTDIQLTDSPLVAQPHISGGYTVFPDGMRITGWMERPDGTAPAKLAVEVGTRQTAVLLACNPEPDLTAIGGTDLPCGFAGLLPPGTSRDDVRVRDLASGAFLPAFRPEKALASVVGSNPILPLAPTSKDDSDAPRWTRFLVAVWGESYITLFCTYCLPTLLSANNIPALAARRKFEFVVLTRSTDHHHFEASPAFALVRSLTTVLFIDIDDILQSSFDRNPHAYGIPLTRAYFRGIRQLGERMKQVDFIFWNADFIASDGTLRRLADLIDSGVRCTLAPSLRIVREDAERFFDTILEDNPAAIKTDSHDLVRLGIKHMHPTVTSKMVNGKSKMHITTANQFYWDYGPDLLVGRFFLLFMLHFRPEVVLDDIHGFCDYAFVPEFVPSGSIHYETDSEDMFIGELQYRDKEGGDIIGTGQQVRPEDVAERIGYWATREQRNAAEQVLLFKAAAVEPDMAAIRSHTDVFMNRLFQLLPKEPRWHYNHPYWVGSCQSIGERYVGPPVHLPTSYLAKDWAWTGFDLDPYRDGFVDQPHLAFRQILAAPPTSPSVTPDTAWLWLRRLDEAYRDAFAAAPPAASAEGMIDLGGFFYGYGWGFRRQSGASVVRRLGPHRRGTILLRVQPDQGYRLRIEGVRPAESGTPVLGLLVNGSPAADQTIVCHGDRYVLKAGIHRGACALGRGILAVELIDGGSGDPVCVHTCSFTPAATMTETALSRLGRDRELYAAASRHLSEEFRLLLAAGPTDCRSDSSVRCWLETLDREFARSIAELDWPEAPRQRIDLAGEVPGFGWGGIVHAGNTPGRRLSDDGEATLFLRLDRRDDWIVTADLHSSGNPADLLGMSITVEGQALLDTAFRQQDGILSCRGRLPRLADGTDSAPVGLRIACGSPEKTVAETERPRRVPDAVILAVRAFKPDAPPTPDVVFTFSSTTPVQIDAHPSADIQDRLEESLDNLSRLTGCDLHPYLTAAQAVGEDCLNVFIAGLEALADGRHEQSLWLGGLDLLFMETVASLPALSTEGTSLSGGVPGFGWATCTYANGSWGRRTGPAGSAFLVLDLPEMEECELQLHCSWNGASPPDVTAFAGTERLPALPVIHAGNEAVLRWIVPSRPAKAGRLAVEIRDAMRTAGSGGCLFTDASLLPRSSAPPLPAIPESETDWERSVLEAQGRDFAPYGRALRLLGNPFLSVFRSLRRTPAEDPILVQHWMDLLDREIATQWWNSAPPPATSVDIDFLRPVQGLRWGGGALRMRRHGRHLDNSGKATLFVRLQEGPSYRIAVTFGKGEDIADAPCLTANGVVLNMLEEDRGWLLPADLVRAWCGMLAIGIDSRGGKPLFVHHVACHPDSTSSDGADECLSSGMAMPISPEGRRDLFLASVLGPGVRNVDYLNWLEAIGRDEIATRRRQIDIALYRHASSTLGEEYSRMLANCPSEACHNDSFCANWHNQVNAAYARAISLGGIALPGSGVLNFADRFHGLNWGDCTYEQGVAGRYLGGMKEATVFLKLDPDRDHLLTVHLHPAHAVAGLRLQVAVNRHPIAVRHETGGSGDLCDLRLSWTLNRFDLSALKGLVAVTFTCERETGEWYGAFCGGIAATTIEKVAVPALSKLVVQAQESVIPASPRAFERPTAVHIAVPVWGKAYIDLYESIALPSILGSNNLPAIRDMGVAVHVMTDEAGRQALMESARFQTVREIAREVVFHPLDEVRAKEATKGRSLLTSNYDAMTAFHRLVLDKAAGSGGAAVFLNADTVYAANAFSRIAEVASRGLRTIEALTLRTNRDTIVPALAKLAGSKGIIDIAPRDLMHLAFQNTHPITMARFWKGPPGLMIPDNLYWVAGPGAIVARCTHYMPVYVFPRLPSVTFNGTIDHDLVANIGVDDTERWLVPDTDQFTGIEVSPPSHSQNFAPYECGSATSMVRYFELCQPVHERNLQHICRIHDGRLPEEAWKATVEESGAVVDRVLAAVKEAQMNPGMPAWWAP